MMLECWRLYVGMFWCISVIPVTCSTRAAGQACIYLPLCVFCKQISTRGVIKTQPQLSQPGKIASTLI